MLESILEDSSVPIVGSAFISIDHMDQNLQFRFIRVILQDLYDLCF